MVEILEEFRFLTLDEAAKILKVSRRTIFRLLQQNNLPALKVGGQWRISERKFREWLEDKEKPLPKV